MQKRTAIISCTGDLVELPCLVVPDAHGFVHTARGDQLLSNARIASSHLRVVIAIRQECERGHILSHIPWSPTQTLIRLIELTFVMSIPEKDS